MPDIKKVNLTAEEANKQVSSHEYIEDPIKELTRIILKKAEEKKRVTTPAATIGVRG